MVINLSDDNLYYSDFKINFSINITIIIIKNKDHINFCYKDLIMLKVITITVIVLNYYYFMKLKVTNFIYFEQYLNLEVNGDEVPQLLSYSLKAIVILANLKPIEINYTKFKDLCVTS